jgi:signal transduction histidine kinase
MEVIRTSAKRMTRLINDLLDVTRIDVGHKLPIEASRIEVEPLVRELMEIFSPQAEARGVSLTADAKLAGAHARADRDRLIQAMSNIIGNALKFTPEGGSISLRVTSEDGMIHLAVSDTGPGIPEENLSHIWDPYWQMNRNARMGAGLGLAIVKGIVDAHGGRITVDSSAGSGTTFDVAIPGDLVTSDE